MSRILRLVLRVIAPLLGLLLIGVFVYRTFLSNESSACDALRRADLRTLSVIEGTHVTCAGISSRPASPALVALFNGDSGGALAEALRKQKGAGLAFSPGTAQARGVGLKLARFEHIPGLRVVVLATDFVVVVPGVEIEFTDREREALSYVARAMLRGAREPSVTSFPAALRRVLRTEIMVTLSDRGEPRLWRSARGTSIARSLMTATRVARDRWRERESTMGGPLVEQLGRLDVAVSMLLEDGTLANTQQSFVDQVVTKTHGIGIDYRSDWYYALPEAAHKQQGSAYRGLLSLLSDRGLSASAITEPGTRVYRFVPVELSISRALPSTARSASDGDSD